MRDIFTNNPAPKGAFHRFPHRVALNWRGSSSVYRTCEYEKPVRSAMALIATSRVGHSCNSCGYSSSIMYLLITLSGITPRSIRYSIKLTSVGSGVAAWYFSRMAAMKSLCNSCCIYLCYLAEPTNYPHTARMATHVFIFAVNVVIPDFENGGQGHFIDSQHPVRFACQFDYLRV